MRIIVSYWAVKCLHEIKILHFLHWSVVLKFFLCFHCKSCSVLMQTFLIQKKKIDNVYCKLFIVHERNVVNLMNPGTFVNIRFYFVAIVMDYFTKISLESA